MINRFRIQNYKALRDVTIELTPIHVLIGPNDSGKTSVLEAIGALCRTVDQPLDRAFAGEWQGRQLVWRGEADLTIGLTASIAGATESFDYHLACSCAATGRQMTLAEETIRDSSTPEGLSIGNLGDGRSRTYRLTHDPNPSADLFAVANQVHDALSGVLSFRWDPRFLALPVAPDANRNFRMEPSGFGLALCLDDILSFDRERFTQLEDRFRKVFPHIESIKLIRENAYQARVDSLEQVEILNRSAGKGIYFSMEGMAEPISARQVSDGVLLVLAYLTILYLPQPPRVLLIEEPENGIHPKRLKDVLAIVRDLVAGQDRTQIILTTHSPYAVDLFEPNEVTLCQKQQDGSIRVLRLSDSKPVQEQSDYFTLGEIWTGEGDDALAQAANKG